MIVYKGNSIREGDLVFCVSFIKWVINLLLFNVLFFIMYVYMYMTYWVGQKLIQIFQFSSVTQSGLTLCHPMDCSTPGLPVHRQLPEFTQTHIHWVGDAIQPSHPLSTPLLLLPSILPSIRVFSNESVLRIIGVSVLASVPPMNIQDWFPLGWTGLISLLSKGLSSVFSTTTVQKHQFFNA